MTNEVQRAPWLRRPEGYRDFPWLTGRGVALPIRDMESEHLFFVLRMVWNAFMPAEARLGRHINRGFGEQHPTHYLQEAVRCMFAELRDRGLDALKQEYRDQLEQMAAYLRQNRTELLQLPEPGSDTGRIGEA